MASASKEVKSFTLIWISLNLNSHVRQMPVVLASAALKLYREHRGAVSPWSSFHVLFWSTWWGAGGRGMWQDHCQLVLCLLHHSAAFPEGQIEQL